MAEDSSAVAERAWAFVLFVRFVVNLERAPPPRILR
jgi:hypothetical protein